MTCIYAKSYVKNMFINIPIFYLLEFLRMEFLGMEFLFALAVLPTFTFQ